VHETVCAEALQCLSPYVDKVKNLVDVLLRHAASINARLAGIVKGNNKAAIWSQHCVSQWGFVTNLVEGVHEDE
jgi:hypothetical protein